MNILLLISLLINFYGYFSDSPVLVSFAQIILCLSFALDHYKKYKLTNINPIFVFSIGSIYTAFGHFLAFHNINEKEGAYFQYFKYSVPENYTEAMEIYFIGILFVFLGFNFAIKPPVLLPKINFKIHSFTVFRYLFYFSILLIFIQGMIALPGSFQKIITLFPLLSLFILNLVGLTYNIRLFKTYSIVLTIICAVYYLFTSYLRFEIISPLILFIISNIIVSKNLKSLLSFRLLPIFILIILFSLSFSKLGNVRTQYLYTWDQKLDFLINDQEATDESEEEQKKQTILSRSTVINQLTQVVKVKKEDGLYYGQTLIYLTYAFIPRIIWPEKPIIQQGGWFAERIGMAYRNEFGNINNSINMTIYGEAYLNYDYYGVLFISFLFGYFIAKLWLASGELKNYFNIIGVGFSLYLISISVFQLGADIQMVVTLMSIYLIFLLLSVILKEIYGSE